jgi:hypothetical protein
MKELLSMTKRLTIHPCKVAYAAVAAMAAEKGGFDSLRGREIAISLEENEDLSRGEVLIACRAAAAAVSAKTGKCYGTLLNQILLGLKGEYDQPPRRWGHDHYNG